MKPIRWSLWLAPIAALVWFGCSASPDAPASHADMQAQPEPKPEPKPMPDPKPAPTPAPPDTGDPPPERAPTK